MPTLACDYIPAIAQVLPSMRQRDTLMRHFTSQVLGTQTCELDTMAFLHPYRHLHAYVHNGRIGVLVEVGCETDFVTRTEEFKVLINDVALQIAAMAPEDVDALLEQPFVKDGAHTVGQIVHHAGSKFRERIAVTRFIRWSTDAPECHEEPNPPRTPALIMSFGKVR
jgi:elongation factor Ts